MSAYCDVCIPLYGTFVFTLTLILTGAVSACILLSYIGIMTIAKASQTCIFTAFVIHLM